MAIKPVALLAQGSESAAPASAPAASEPAQTGISQEIQQPLAAESAKAEGKGKAAGKEAKEDDQEKMVNDLKFSPTVRAMAKMMHVSPTMGYWIGIMFDFLILAGIVAFALKKNLPTMFANRTKAIQQGIEEARKASQEAQGRISEVESRLSKLDGEIASMRATAEKEAAAEEKRVLVSAEEDARRIVQAAETEITAATRAARRELQSYVADLAVTLAERRIQVDTATDQQLLRGFVGQLGTADQPENGRAKGRG